MNTLRMLWFLIAVLFYPLRYGLWLVHRFAVFLSKAGARWIIPLFMLSLGMLLRSRIDAYAGEAITDFYEGFGEPAFGFRIEITFAVLFLLLFFSLKIVAYVMSPIVGALPVPARPLAPMRPLFARKHVVRAYPAGLAVSAAGSGSFSGKLDRLNRYLPPHIVALLKTPPAPEPDPLPERAVHRPAMRPAEGQGAAPRSAAPPRAQPAPPPPQQPLSEDIAPGYDETPPHQSQRGEPPPPREVPRRPAPPAQPPMPPRIQRPEGPRPPSNEPDGSEPPRPSARTRQAPPPREAPERPQPPAQPPMPPAVGGFRVRGLEDVAEKE